MNELRWSTFTFCAMALLMAATSCTDAPVNLKDTFTAGDDYLPFEENGKFGYLNAEGIAIEPQFNNAFPFSEGLAAVRQGGYFGFIDTAGTWVIAPQFDFAQAFSNGIAVVYEANGAPNYVNRKGKLLLGEGFKGVFPFDAYHGVFLILEANR